MVFIYRSKIISWPKMGVDYTVIYDGTKVIRISRLNFYVNKSDSVKPSLHFRHVVMAVDT